MQPLRVLLFQVKATFVNRGRMHVLYLPISCLQNFRLVLPSRDLQCRICNCTSVFLTFSVHPYPHLNNYAQTRNYTLVVSVGGKHSTCTTRLQCTAPLNFVNNSGQLLALKMHLKCVGKVHMNL